MLRGGSGRTFLGFLWFWGKVILCLALLDALVFQTGWFWLLKPTQSLHLLTRRIEEHPDGEPVAIAVGSSVVRMSMAEARIDRRMKRHRVPSAFRNLGLDGIRAIDAALIAHTAREMHPWLVIYGAAFRDFIRPAAAEHPGRQRSSRVQELFLDSSFDLEALAPDSVDEWIARVVRRHWTLYRHRGYVRAVLAREGARWVGRLTGTAEARPLPRRPPAQGIRADDPALANSPALPAWLRWQRTSSFADYEEYLSKRGKMLELYRQARGAPFDLSTSPEVEGLEHLLRTSRERGTRVVLVYCPENPVFRDPAAAEYFDPHRSDEVAALLAREAARYGARFVDLRTLLPAEDFIDMVHLNHRGASAVTDEISRIVIQEWSAANEAAVTDGAFVP